eukprot:5488872-Pleurochrysis_carterae.AAC.1
MTVALKAGPEAEELRVAASAVSKAVPLVLVTATAATTAAATAESKVGKKEAVPEAAEAVMAA